MAVAASTPDWPVSNLAMLACTSAKSANILYCAGNIVVTSANTWAMLANSLVRMVNTSNLPPVYVVDSMVSNSAKWVSSLEMWVNIVDYRQRMTEKLESNLGMWVNIWGRMGNSLARRGSTAVKTVSNLVMWESSSAKPVCILATTASNLGMLANSLEMLDCKMVKLENNLDLLESRMVT